MTSTLAQTPAFPRRKTMTITQTYFLAHKARAKLSREAARSDHDLRLLVGHANMLDALMLDLADAEREQESWFNQSVKAAPAAAPADRHVRWADSALEEEVSSDDDNSSSDSDSEYEEEEEEDFEMADAVLATRRTPAKPVATLQSTQQSQIPELRLYAAEDDENMHEELDEDDEDFAHLALTRSPSHSATSSPPELLLDHDSDSSSDDESMPPSPPSNALPSFEDKKSAVASTRYLDDASSAAAAAADKDDFYEQGFYLPPRNPARLVSAISVY